MRAVHRLSAAKVAGLKKPGRYPDGLGLYLQISETVAKSWVFRYQRAGRERMLGLGPLHTVSLAAARQAARKVRESLRDGIDPLKARKTALAQRILEEARTITFEAAARAYYRAHADKWSNAAHRGQVLTTLTDYAFPTLGRLPVAEIDTGLVLRVLEPIWRRIPKTANRTRARIEAVLEWAKAHGYRTGDNPAAWSVVGHALPAPGQIAPVKHLAALPYSELPTFMAALRTIEGFPARALELLILTAVRTKEVIGAEWNEFDLSAGLWTVPAIRTKKKREHRVPLSPPVVKLLRALPRERNYVFIGARTGAMMAERVMRTLLVRMGHSDITVHGFRSSFRDWAAERSSFPHDVVEQALAHRVGTATELAYKRSELIEHRRRLMGAWATFLAHPVNEGAVVPLKARQ